MKFATLSVVVASLLSLGMAAPQRGRNRQQEAADKQALINLDGKPVDPNLPPGRTILSNGQGNCAAVQGVAVCQDLNGNSIN
ncbi:hypothetical protein MAPG_10526 [Magnaporthiopsis poae ATCC 64411]|uniref:Uncharacterized protein n=1 Tax=Magnaporthiopsis poae (strain ATCC 64411 / 73-15) TaxID=644358 RepID=A0A0C4ECU1_MAGP6|nr:hypothetical protein MAPG_10526 [Magnaporthiopsis poae ATCC 64411]